MCQLDSCTQQQGLYGLGIYARLYDILDFDVNLGCVQQGTLVI